MSADFAAILQAQSQRYPLMAPQDYGKLAYQHVWGPAHLALSPQQAQEGLLAEWTQQERDAAAQAPEAIGNDLCRFHLTRAYAPEEAAPLVAELFCRTAGEHSGSAAEWAQALAELETLPVAGMAAWLDDYQARGCPAVSHSERFRTAYAPHYRLLRAEYAWYFPALLAVQQLLEKPGPRLVAIDGRCGSGKTALAALIQRLFPCNVCHMDDFYRPLDERAPDWAETPGGNMDFARLSKEVLWPVQAGERVSYRPYSCQRGALGEAVHLPSRQLTVIEGSYSGHQDLAAAFDLQIFLTCSPETQERRLSVREGDYFPAFQRRWIPLEERYLASGSVEAASAVVLDTTSFF